MKNDRERGKNIDEIKKNERSIEGRDNSKLSYGMHNIHKSKWFIAAVAGLVEIILLLLVFRLGMVLGAHRAEFEGVWAKNYGRLFGEPKKDFFAEFSRDDRINPFGNAGIVLSANGNIFVMKSSNNIEKTILVTTSTIIRSRMSTIGVSDIKVGDPIVVIGDPNGSGEIVARFVRTFPLPSSLPPLSATGASQ